MSILSLFGLIIFCYAIEIFPNNNNTSRQFIGIVIVILIFAFIGIILSFIILTQIMNHHTQKLWLKQEDEKYILKDFHGKINQLKQSNF